MPAEASAVSRCCCTLLSLGLSRNHSHIRGDTKPVGSFRARPTLVVYGTCHHTNPTPRINMRSTPESHHGLWWSMQRGLLSIQPGARTVSEPELDELPWPTFAEARC